MASMPTSTLAEHVERMLSLVKTTLESLAPAQRAQHRPDTTLAAFGAAIDGSHERLEAALTERYDLSPTDMAVLWFCAAPHLDPGLCDLIARACDNILRTWVDPALCMLAFCGSVSERLAMRARFLSDGALLRSGLVSLQRRDNTWGDPLNHQVMASEQLVSFVCGVRAVGGPAASITHRVEPEFNLSVVPFGPNAPTVFTLLESFFSRPSPATAVRHGQGGFDYANGLALVAEGPRGSGRVDTIKAIAGELERTVLLVDGARLAAMTPTVAVRALETLFFEAELHGELICITHAAALVGTDSPLVQPLIDGVAQRQAAVVLCLGRDDDIAAGLDTYIVSKASLHMPTHHDAVASLWALHCDGLVRAEDVDFPELSEAIHVAPWQIRKAVTLAYYQGYPKLPFDGPTHLPTPVVGDTALLRDAARGQVSTAIGTLAVVSEPHLALSDLIVNSQTLEGIQEIIGAVRHRQRVLTEWGIGARIRSGTGIIALFDGDPGTGKTHAAGVLAGVLGLSLVRINIASVVDKYIGETEKNLARIFERVRPDISLLLFDEADSMFTKRVSNVSRSTDRYSNMNVNALLQLVEHYQGVTVLTTNLKRAIDPAFERRFTFKLHFDLPSEPERLRLWQYLLPETLPCIGDVDYQLLAELELTGGEIKNAILLGCYQAAGEQALVGTKHLYHASVREATATGRVVRYDIE